MAQLLYSPVALGGCLDHALGRLVSLQTLSSNNNNNNRTTVNRTTVNGTVISSSPPPPTTTTAIKTAGTYRGETREHESPWKDLVPKGIYIRYVLTILTPETETHKIKLP